MTQREYSQTPQCHFYTMHGKILSEVKLSKTYAGAEGKFACPEKYVRKGVCPIGEIRQGSCLAEEIRADFC